jgi:hypothetical protein
MSMMALAYRPNGCLVGVVPGEEWQAADPDERNLAYFGHLVAPPAGSAAIRPLIVAIAQNVPDDIAQDVEEMVTQIGGIDAGFEAADLIREYSNFSPDAEPLTIQLEEPQNNPDRAYKDGTGNILCPVCGEKDCRLVGAV